MLPVMLFVMAPSAMADTFEVTPGSDLQGIFDTLAPGTEVVLTDGTYAVTTTLTISEKSGTEAAPIVIRAADDATPILQVAADVESGEYTDRIILIAHQGIVPRT